MKNLVSQLSLIVRNFEKHGHRPDFQRDMLATVQSAVERMNHLMERLKDLEFDELQIVTVGPLIEKLIAELRSGTRRFVPTIRTTSPSCRFERRPTRWRNHATPAAERCGELRRWWQDRCRVAEGKECSSDRGAGYRAWHGFKSSSAMNSSSRFARPNAVAWALEHTNVVPMHGSWAAISRPSAALGPGRHACHATSVARRLIMW